VLAMDEAVATCRLAGNSPAQSSASMMRPVLMSLVTLLTEQPLFGCTAGG
jgi:hypothetical protein